MDLSPSSMTLQFPCHKIGKRGFVLWTMVEKIELDLPQ